MVEWLETVEPGWLVVAGLALTVLTWRVGVHLGRVRDRLRREDRMSRARRGEATAERLLERRGYQICETQVPRDWEIQRGDETVSVRLRADAIVERDGSRLVAEVKTGRQAPDLGVAATRRQLLEYRVAYEVDGIALVDVEAGRVDTVDFGLSPGSEGGEGRDRAICLTS